MGKLIQGILSTGANSSNSSDYNTSNDGILTTLAPYLGLTLNPLLSMVVPVEGNELGLHQHFLLLLIAGWGIYKLLARVWPSVQTHFRN